MKLLHTADLHLGSPLRAASLRDSGQGALLAGGAAGVLDRVVDTALAERVAAVLLAGDVFDNDAADVTLRARLAVQLRRLTQAGIQVVMIRGNHDALAEIERYGPLGEGIHLLDAATPSIRIGEAVIHGLGFQERHANRSMLPDYPAPEPGRLNIGLMHTSLDGAATQDPYAPSATADLLAHGYDYWALGHIHKRAQIVSGGVAIVMPGIPQGRHINESGIGTVTIATLGGMPDLRQVPVASVAFERLGVDLTGCDMVGIIGRLTDAVPPEDGVHRFLRVEAIGATMPEADLAALVRETLAVRDDLSVESLRASDAGRASAKRADAGPLAAAMTREASNESFRDEAARIVAELRDALPREVADALAPDELDALISDGLREALQVLAPDISE